MGRQRKFVGNKLFFYEANTATCTIEECDYVYTPKKGSEVHSKPLIDHLKRKHPDIYKKAVEVEDSKKQRPNESMDYYLQSPSQGPNDEQEPPKIIKFSTTKKSIREMAVEAVSTNGLPLCVFEKSGIAKMLAPVLNQLDLTLSATNVRAWTIDAAQKKVEETKQAFAGKMISVKVDLCTRRGRHFIGINIQAVVEDELKVVTAAVAELHERATAVAIRGYIVRCLAKLGISEKHIYSLTTDNGSNVIKVGDLMRSDFALAQQNCGSEDDDEHDVAETSDNELDVEALTAEDGVMTVRCAVHTLQLSVHDFFRANSEVKDIISKAHNIAKKTHKQSIRELFKNNNRPLPRLDCETRWGSTYSMLHSMLLVRDLLDQIALANESLLLSNADWMIIQGLTACLKPVYEATVAIQLKKLTAGEFFAEWLKCKTELQRNSMNSANALAMLSAMERREANLLSNAAFVSAIYVDPRFKVLLKYPQQNVAQVHLAALWRRLQVLQESAGSPDMIEISSESGNESNASGGDIIEEILASSDACSANTSQSSSTRHEQNVIEMINSFKNQARLRKDADVFEWWKNQAESDLKQVAAVALALPVTQASVERTFSGLRYILHELRLGLKEDIIEAIMFLRCNT